MAIRELFLANFLFKIAIRLTVYQLVSRECFLANIYTFYVTFANVFYRGNFPLYGIAIAYIIRSYDKDLHVGNMHLMQ